jgi:hypothetical protein
MWCTPHGKRRSWPGPPTPARGSPPPPAAEEANPRPTGSLGTRGKPAPLPAPPLVVSAPPSLAPAPALLLVHGHALAPRSHPPSEDLSNATRCCGSEARSAAVGCWPCTAHPATPRGGEASTHGRRNPERSLENRRWPSSTVRDAPSDANVHKHTTALIGGSPVSPIAQCVCRSQRIRRKPPSVIRTPIQRCC